MEHIYIINDLRVTIPFHCTSVDWNSNLTVPPEQKRVCCLADHQRQNPPTPKDMKTTFLKAAYPLTKTFTKTPSGIEKSNYPNVYEVTSIEEDVPNLKAFLGALDKHAELGHCMLKGNVAKPLVNQSRAGSTDPNAATQMLLLDVDGLNVKTPDEFMKLIGMANVSYVVQYSGSYRIYDDLLRCHIFVWLSEPYAAPVLKQHLIALNFSVPKLKDTLSLTKTGNALRYGLDITTCQNDKLIYIAHPVCNGFKPPTFKRIEYVKRKRESWSFGDPPSVMVNKELVERHIADLRKVAKLPDRKNTYKMVNNLEVLSKPDQSIITGMKEERGFVYFNLNGGDSWAYYHPANNPDFIHNFKGEPTYQTKELLPEYWQQVCSEKNSARQAARRLNGEPILLAFLDKRSSAYWRGTYDPATDALELHSAKNETQVRHFAVQNGFTLPSFIPEWEMIFDPHAKFRVDVEAQRINLFQPSEFMKGGASWSGKRARTFPTIQKVIHHALGSNDAITERFINWLAAIVQTLDRTRTAWILHGRTGTGKGVLFNRILSPLFGSAQCATKRMEELTEPYNGYMERCFIVFVDEVQTSTLRNEKGVMAKIKNFITEPIISIRNMHQNAYPATNYTNWIFASNMPDPVAVDMNDRRFNVGRYQTEPIALSQAEYDAIPNELKAFYDYLAGYKVDIEKASKPMDTDDRKALMQISEASIDTVARALLEGDFDFFMDHLPTNTVGNNLIMDIVEDYKATLLRFIPRTEPNGKCNISRDELRAIFEWCVGDMPKSPNKFTSRMKHHRIHTERLRVDGVVCHAITVHWKNIPSDAKARLTGKPQAVTGTKAA